MKAMNLNARRITRIRAMRMSIDVRRVQFFGEHRRGRGNGLIS
nr:hypothetical protein [uncultured Porphyromonas sp.]